MSRPQHPLHPPAPQQPLQPLQPLETNEVRVLAVGTGLWAVAVVTALVFGGFLRAAGHDRWLAICLAGAALGLAEVAYTRLRRRRAQRLDQEPARSG